MHLHEYVGGENALLETVNRGVMHDVELLLIFCGGGCGVRMFGTSGCWGYICVKCSLHH